MKKIVQAIGISIMALWVFSCAGGKDSMYSFENDPPFELTKGYFQKWVAGIQQGGSGTNVHLTIENVTEEVEFREVYFRNRKEKVSILPTSPDDIVVNFKHHENREIIMDSDPVKEAQNTPPEVFPFRLKENEAVLSYFQKGEEKYFKVTQMEEKPMLAYPSANPNGIE